MADVADKASTMVGNGTSTTWGGIKQGTQSELYTKTKDIASGGSDNKYLKDVAYGKTVYIPVYAGAVTAKSATGKTGDLGLGAQFTKADDVDGLKVSAKWDKNGEYVESVELVKKDGKYWVAIKTTGSSMDDNDVEGTITFTGKAYEYEWNSTKSTWEVSDKKTKIEKAEYDVIITLNYKEYNGSEANKAYELIYEDPCVYVFDENAVMSDEEFEFTCDEADEVTFTVDTTHQSDIILAMDTDSIDEVEDAYPAANLDFYVFNGATFRKTGELFIPADEGEYLYEVVDGAVKDVDAEYDDYDEGFYLKTKTLGAYVVSDTKLAVAAATEADATATTNPTTGAAL